MERQATLIDASANHFKFYRVKVVGSTWTATWGRIGKWSQSKTYHEVSEWSAKAAANERFNSKLAKGYSEHKAACTA